MASLIEIETEEAFDQIIKTSGNGQLFVIYFYAPWAAPCAQMNTILTALASTYPADAPIKFLSINAEELPDISEAFDVTAVPFLVLQRDNNTLETVSGSDATKVRTAVEKYTSGQNANSIPPALQATPQQQANGNANGNAPTTTKDLSSYAPKPLESATVAAQESQEELNERLGKLVKAAPVMLFMKGTPSAPQCGFSRQLVGILRENHVKYGFFNILADDDVREGLKTFSDWPTFPQLYTNGDLIGGLDIVREELSADPDFFKPFSAAAAPSATA